MTLSISEFTLARLQFTTMLYQILGQNKRLLFFIRFFLTVEDLTLYPGKSPEPDRQPEPDLPELTEESYAEIVQEGVKFVIVLFIFCCSRYFKLLFLRFYFVIEIDTSKGP